MGKNRKYVRYIYGTSYYFFNSRIKHDFFFYIFYILLKLPVKSVHADVYYILLTPPSKTAIQSPLAVSYTAVGYILLFFGNFLKTKIRLKTLLKSEMLPVSYTFLKFFVTICQWGLYPIFIYY